MPLFSSLLKCSKWENWSLNIYNCMTKLLFLMSQTGIRMHAYGILACASNTQGDQLSSGFVSRKSD